MIVNLLIALGATLVVHELGHAAAAAALRLPWQPVLTRHGPGMKIGSDDFALTRREVTLTSAGGPVANILLAAAAIHFGLGLLALLNLEFAVLNLLPFPRSDGRRILYGQETK